MMGRSSDFMFWEEKYHRIHRDPKGDDLEFKVPKHVQDQLEAHSPLLWPRTPPIDFHQEISSLPPRNHRHYRCLSPRSRSREIRDGRRELMEMIKNVPESEYELSLKDIVDEQKIMGEEEVPEEVVVAEEKKVKGKMGNGIIPQKSYQIHRTESMEREVFLLKMFLPISLSFNKKPKARKQSQTRSAQSQTSQGSDKQTNKDWWKMISLAVKENQISTIINSNRAREKKCKPRGQRGCLFGMSSSVAKQIIVGKPSKGKEQI